VGAWRGGWPPCSLVQRNHLSRSSGVSLWSGGGSITVNQAVPARIRPVTIVPVSQRKVWHDPDNRSDHVVAHVSEA
jgi:hypothetical protein